MLVGSALPPMSSSMTRDPPLDGQLRVGEREAQLVGALERPGEAEEVVLDRRELALGARDLEHRLGVGLDLRTLAVVIACSLPTESM